MIFIKFCFKIFILITVIVFIINYNIRHNSKDYIYTEVKDIPKCYTAIVLGAFVYKSGNPSGILKDRLDKSIELYKKGKISKFLLSGDHGRNEYDEVNNMKDYLSLNGITQKDIFMDHAGFDTYNSIVRAKEIFEVKDAIIVSQQFHLSRAVYIARSKDLNAYGIIADTYEYPALRKLKLREIFANVKAAYEIAVNKRPVFLGDKIPITGNSKLSYD